MTCGMLAAGDLCSLPPIPLSPPHQVNCACTQETSKDGMTRVYKSLVTNVCKEMSCYSDVPFQEDYPNFMNHEKFWNYLQEFAEHFDLLKYIQFKVRWLGLWKVNE